MVGEGGAVEPPRQTTSLAAFSTALARSNADARNPRPLHVRGAICKGASILLKFGTGVDLDETSRGQQSAPPYLEN